MSSTTIKVSHELRDRIAERARAQGITLAAAIDQALDASDEQHFWAAVREEHMSLTTNERDLYMRSGGTDDLPDSGDEEISRRNEW